MKQQTIRDVELRTGRPYANLIQNQALFCAVAGERLRVDRADVLPAAGATGAIEAVRNHVYRRSPKHEPSVLTVRPGYWRARESFQGLGFKITELKTEPLGFAIDEAALVDMAAREDVDLLYLSLPNNPTGAVFDPEIIISRLPETASIMIDLTLPSRDLDGREVTAALYERFRGRRNLFLIGSLSKSHGTAEYRIGWAVCANSGDADILRKENRNVVSSISITQAVEKINQAPAVLELIQESFAYLKEGELRGRFEIIRPERSTKTGYVLTKTYVAEDELKSSLRQDRILVMWGSDFGLTDRYLRLETLEPESIKIFVDAVNRCAIQSLSA